MQNVTDLDDFLDNMDDEKPLRKGKAKPKAKDANPGVVRNEIAGIGAIRQKEIKVKGLEDGNNIVPVNVALNRHAAEKMNRYLKKSTQYKTLDKQIELLKAEMLTYGKAKNYEFVEKTKQLIKDLQQQKTQFLKYFKGDNYKAENAESEEKIKNSPRLKELKTKLDSLKLQYTNTNPNSLMRQLKALKDAMDAKTSFEDEIEDDDVNDIDSIYGEDSDEKINGSGDIEQEYIEICSKIATILDDSVASVMEMKLGPLSVLLKKYCPSTEPVKKEIDLTKAEIAAERKKIKGGNDITDVIFDIFDFSKDESEPKELLAAANIKYVSAIAYKQCSKLNKMMFFDDACSAGLLGLSKAINRWYEGQKLVDCPFSFEGFAYTDIVMAIKKDLYVWTSGGKVSPDVLATIDHRRKKSIEMWLKINPDFKNVPQDMLEHMLEGLIEEKPVPVFNESDISTMIGGDDTVESDVWANSGSSNGEDSIVDAKFQHEEILKGIGALFNLFKTETDKETGVRTITDQKIFTKYDLKLFMMKFEMEFKHNAPDGDSRFRLEEIATVLRQMYKNDGIVPKGGPEGLNESSISTRYKVILEKIKTIMEENPLIKKGFQYYLLWCEQNRDTMQLLSNYREEVGTAKELKIISDFHKKANDNAKDKAAKEKAEAILSKKLNNGLTLNDVYQKTDSNPFDDQIAQVVKILPLSKLKYEYEIWEFTDGRKTRNTGVVAKTTGQAKVEIERFLRMNSSKMYSWVKIEKKK